MKNKGSNLNNKTSESSEIDAKIDTLLKNSNEFSDKAEIQNKIAEIQQLLDQNKGMSDGERSSLEVILGNSYMAIDQIKGIGILKNTALNEDYPKQSRALAINTVMNYCDYALCKNLFRDQIFTGNIFGDFNKDGNVNLAIARLADYADGLYPTVFSAYRGAEFYSLALNDNNLSAGQKKDLVSKATSRLGRGKALFASDTERLKWTSINSQKGLAYKMEAIIWGNLKFYGDPVTAASISNESIADAYKNSISALETNPQDRYMKYASGYSRLYYANFLATVNSKKNLEETKNTLAPLYDPAVKDYPIAVFLKNGKTAEETNIKMIIDRLSAIDPDFKKFVDSL